MDQSGDQASTSGGVPACNTSSPPALSTCGSSSSVRVGVAGVDSVLVPVVLDDLTFDNRQVRPRAHARCNVTVSYS